MLNNSLQKSELNLVFSCSRFNNILIKIKHKKAKQIQKLRFRSLPILAKGTNDHVIITENTLTNTMAKNLLILTIISTLLGACFILYKMYDIQKRANECAAYVHQGIDLTGKGKNNCANPELIP